ncbi:MAG: YHS domain-containing protein [Gammaproteobacteria bacterium]|nr:YHS domain-containing protein [Gammaproteobacteria bacterium]
MVQDPVCQMKFSPREARVTTEYEGKLYYFCSPACRDTFISQPNLYLKKVSSMFLTVGVMGSAGNESADDIIEKSRNLGKNIAQRGFVLITGACPGLPYECASGAKLAGGLSIGISPALSLDEHIHKYRSPADVYDVIIYTGSGLMGREVTNIRSSDMVIILGGRSGTLGEFAIAFDEGKLIGVLQGSGGITDQIPDIVTSFQKDSGARLVYADDPVTLINKMAKLYTEHHYQHPSCFCDEMATSAG